MTKLIWQEEFSLHIKEIDEQHKQWVGLIGRLNDAITQGQVEKDLEKIFDQIYEHTALHFATEEKYFKLFGYDGADQHIAAHQGFTKKISSLQKQLHENNKFQISLELAAMLEIWVADHVLAMDKKYEKCFHEHGLR